MSESAPMVLLLRYISEVDNDILPKLNVGLIQSQTDVFSQKKKKKKKKK